jgi:DNA-binding CsgD family transcriptional regulator
MKKRKNSRQDQLIILQKNELRILWLVSNSKTIIWIGLKNAVSS